MSPETTKAALQVLDLATSQLGEDCLQGRKASARTEDGHQMDGGVAGLTVAAVTGPTAGLEG